PVRPLDSAFVISAASVFLSASCHDMKSADFDISGLKVGAIINTSSGGCDSESEAEMLDILKGAGVSNCRTWCGESDQTELAFADAATYKPKVLVVLGGDGTIRTAAEACAGTDTYVLPLPGGTLNMLPRALYGDLSWQNALKTTLAAPLTKTLSGGGTGAGFLGPPACGWKRANPYGAAPSLMPSRKVWSRFKQCSTHRFGIPFHRRYEANLKLSR